MKLAIHYLEKFSKRQINLISVAMVVLATGIDLLIGPDVSSAIFYFIPISIAAWYDSRDFGLFIAVISALIWYVIDHKTGKQFANMAIPLWNAFMRLSIFVMFAMLIAGFRQKMKEEEELADKDSLTGATSSHAFYEHAANEILRTSRYHRPFTVAYIDLDNFKYVNDRYGHTTGDELLQSVVRIMQANVRDFDIVARMGGDEFVILFPEVGTEMAPSAIKKIINMLNREMKNNEWPVTPSIGMITFLLAPTDVKQMLAMADKLMYRVKKSGKNSVLHGIYDGENILEKPITTFV